MASSAAYAKKTDFSPSEKPIIWYQGALNEGRGLEYMIAAMPYLEGYEFWMAGEGDLSQILRQLVVEKKLEEHIKFLGKLLPPELGELAPRFTLGINIAEDKGLSYYYSLANRTFDYIHAALPAIHSNFPEYQNIIKEYAIGETLESLEPEKLAAQIRGIVENSRKYQAMKLACQVAKAEFCWEKEEIKLLKFYKRIF
jgi:glycosyltransferase involved in cell wall biosynthesis